MIIEFRNSGGYSIAKLDGCPVAFAIPSELRYSLTHPGTLSIINSLISSTTALTRTSDRPLCHLCCRSITRSKPSYIALITAGSYGPDGLSKNCSGIFIYAAPARHIICSIVISTILAHIKNPLRKPFHLGLFI